MEAKTELIISTGLILAMVILVYFWGWLSRRKEKVYTFDEKGYIVEKDNNVFIKKGKENMGMSDI